MLKKIEIIIAFLMLGYVVSFNFHLYKLEPTATTDPNDNNFQFGLVDRANQVWEYANKTCPKNITFSICHLALMTDHWVPNWAQGYNLPFYYSHAPQIVIVGSWRLVNSIISMFHYLPAGEAGPVIPLFTYYHWFIYVLLCIFPVSLFFALRVVGLSWLTAGVGSLIAMQISTDGLYGLDPPSFLWRGWGLSSQLYAMIFLPLALAYGWRVLCALSITNYQLGINTPSSFIRNCTFVIRNSDFWLTVVFTVLTTMGHLGIGIVLFLSFAVMALAHPVQLALAQEKLISVWFAGKSTFTHLFILSFISIFFLSYWIIPTFLNNNYHNISYWDPVWKFNSYGWKETLIRLFNGDLLDFGRFPVLTLLTFVGIFTAPFIKPSKSATNHKPKTYNQSLFSFSLLFAFWLLMYFGRTTWGNLIDLIPGMTEYHLSRFIVGIHLLAMFLIPIGFWSISETIASHIRQFFITTKQAMITPTPSWITNLVLIVLVLFVLPPVYKQTRVYNELNDKLILQANSNAAKTQKDFDDLTRYLRTQPSGRIFAGRGGGWGKNFRIAETEMFMYLSTFGFNTVLWLPETWSPNSDTEQYFSEDQIRDYDLYNIRYVVAPPDQKTQSFWNEEKRGKNWVLYSVPTTGYFTQATRTMVVVSDKLSFANLVRLWIQSPIPSQKLYPELRVGGKLDMDRYKIPTIKMLDEVTYLTAQNNRQNIWAINPLYAGDPPKMEIIGPEVVDSDMRFQTTIKADIGCRECILVLKQTYHPNWKATVNGKSVKPIEVFPSFVAIPISKSGTHEVIVWYQPSTLKVILMCLGLTVAGVLIGLFLKIKFYHFPLDNTYQKPAN